MQIPVSIYDAKLEAKNPLSWSGKLLLWAHQYEEICCNPNITHVKWTSSNESDSGYYNVRKILAKCKFKTWSRAHRKSFYIVQIKDIR